MTRFSNVLPTANVENLRTLKTADHSTTEWAKADIVVLAVKVRIKNRNLMEITHGKKMTIVQKRTLTTQSNS